MGGRTIDCTTEIVEFEPGRRTVMNTVEGPPMVVTYQLREAEDGTHVTIRNHGGSGWMFAIFGPLIARMVKSRVDGDLRALKRGLELVTPG